MSSPYRQQPSHFSDIRPPVRPKNSLWPEAELGKKEEWYIPDVPSAPQAGPSLWQQASRLRQSGEFMRSRARFRSVKAMVLLAVLLLGGIVWGAYQAFETKASVQADGEAGYRYLASAVESMRTERFGDSLDQFSAAHRAFSRGEERLSLWGGPLLDFTRFIPGLSKAATGKYALQAGEHFAAAGIPLARVAGELALSQEASSPGEKISLLDFITRVKAPLQETRVELEAGNQALAKVQIGDIPAEQREAFLAAEQHLPTLIGLIKTFDHNEALLEELLGGNGPRKYLFLFQNNNEMRATGGFIGSYALMDVNNGVVRRFFVDGIFNPDGQLKENIVPPQAIQKVSAAWSLHDSNWFPDFPVSAEKAIFFYEKTGGPTVDGVIALTPTVMQKLLAVTGPIALPQYGLVVDADNFIPVIQEQVETKYDKEENQPKKVLADLTALLLEKVFASQDKTTLYRIAEAFTEGLNEKQMLVYMRHDETEALIDEAGWSGKVLETPGDYLSVINTNINGYKTDGVIDETIKHTAEIGEDGSIVDTVAITRTHRGGQMPYDWWNRVNADYMRVYVPAGSTLLSAKGATWEFPQAPLDYEKLGFRRDADVEREERSIVVDEKSGTRVYRDAGKTVFGAWVYVSPQESVTVEYRYRLPFSIDVDKIRAGGVDSYAALYQKQSGSIGSKLVSVVLFPETIAPTWQMGGNLIPYGRESKLETTLKTDVFAGMVFGIAKQ
ncbi:MAG: hypothetical protein A3E38_00050 [Candidatus Moranbacteria bacterium RIFCSPHIGHO2_12_FULL_54_9]|nr:MAG: hypothetical protein A3E38_00050 [Candidatus Moranbacteria bacterium RIFCSPHIGHO2_12_FULL_54_9]